MDENRRGLLGPRLESGREIWLLRVSSLEPQHVRKYYRSDLQKADPESHLLTDRMCVVFEVHRLGGHGFDPETVGLAEADTLLHEEEVMVLSANSHAFKWYSETHNRTIRHELEWHLDGRPGMDDTSRGSEAYEQEAPPGSPMALQAEQEAFIAASPNPENARWFLGLTSEERDSVHRQVEEQFEAHVQEDLQKRRAELETQIAETVQERDKAQAEAKKGWERFDEAAARVEDAYVAVKSAEADLDRTISKIGGYEIATALKILESHGDVDARSQLADAARAAYPSGFLGVGLEDLYLMREGPFLRSLRRGQKELHRAVQKLCDQRRRERGSRWRRGSLQPSDESELVEIMNQANALRLTVLICRHPFLQKTSQLFYRHRVKDLNFMRKLGLVP